MTSLCQEIGQFKPRMSINQKIRLFSYSNLLSMEFFRNVGGTL